MEIIKNYWGFVPLIFLIAVAIKKFIDMPTEDQIDQLKKWLLWAVAQAEYELGVGTNKLKLAMVYDMFVERFPWMAKTISFNRFSDLVDKALEELKNMIVTNENVKEIIYSSNE